MGFIVLIGLALIGAAAVSLLPRKESNATLYQSLHAASK